MISPLWKKNSVFGQSVVLGQPSVLGLHPSPLHRASVLQIGWLWPRSPRSKMLRCEGRYSHDFMVLGRGNYYHPIGCITLIFKWTYHQLDDICMEYLSGNITNWVIHAWNIWVDISIGNLPDSTVPKISGFIPYYFMVSRGCFIWTGGWNLNVTKKNQQLLGFF